MMKKLGIYVHMPFCKKKCYYCDFISFANKEDLIDKYINALNKEINTCKVSKEEYCINTIYFGGGTPSYIDGNYIVDILKKLYKNFNVLENAEITIEVNPGTINENKLTRYFNAGINRISMGLQTTNDELLKIIGRIHNYDTFVSNYKLARNIGFKNINVDLMIGLPTQTLEDVENDLINIVNLNPEHISVYSLILEEGTKLQEKISKRELFLPSEIIERKMYWKVKKYLEQRGYQHYEISNFSKKGFYSKHNLACWSQEEYLGLGLSAHSYINNVRYSNTTNLKEYVNNKQTKIIHERQNKEDKMKEYMLLGLRKIEGIKISEFKNKFVDNPIYLYKNILNKMVSEKLIKIEDDNIKLTDKGIDFANLVWEEFI